jgi:hypothetical protein
LQKLNKNVGDAQVGTGALTTFLNKSNPALLQQFKNVKSNEEAFDLYIQEVGKLKTPMQKAALSQALFGRAGQEMMKVAEAGADGIAKLRGEARKYGVMSDEATKQSELFVDAMTNLKMAFGGVGKTIGSQLIPMITPLIQKFADFIANNKELIQTKLDSFITKISDAFNVVYPIVKKTFEIFVEVFDFLKPLIPIILGVVAALKAYAAIQSIINIVTAAYNLIMMANPVVLIIMAVIAVVTLLYLIWKKYSNQIIAIFFSIGAFFKSVWDKIKSAGLMVWEALKTGAGMAIGFIKKVLFTFADYFLTVWGSIIKGVLGAASKVGSVFGMDTSGIDNVINKVDSLQKKVRAGSFIGDVQARVQAPNAGAIAAEVSSRQSLDINVNNNTDNQIQTKRGRARTTSRPMLAGAN